MAADSQNDSPVSDRLSLDQMWQISYPELRSIAMKLIAYRRRDAGGLEADELLNELYILLSRQPTDDIGIGGGFHVQAASLMRRILVESARWRRHIPLDQVELPHLEDERILELGQALEDLERLDKDIARIVDLRFFAGLTFQEISELLGTSRSRVTREWSIAKRILAQTLSSNLLPEESSSKSREHPQETERIERPFGGLAVLNLVSPALLIAIQQDPRILSTLGWREFEYLLAETLARLGYEVELQQGTKDGGIDIFAIKKTDPFGPHRYLLQAKRSRSAIGVNPVRELLFLHQHHRMTRSCLATTSVFTRGAWKLAEEYPWQLELKDSERLREWIDLAVKTGLR
jgi:RNA polymerase sigma factor (TIGR02999 family)